MHILRHANINVFLVDNENFYFIFFCEMVVWQCNTVAQFFSSNLKLLIKALH
jgi:hypothetical protein